MSQVHATIAHHLFDLRRTTIERAVRGVLPEPLEDHFVVIGGRRFPPKQVISIVTGLDRAEFNTHQARQVLSRLGFTAGRRQASPVRDDRATDRKRVDHEEADVLRPFVGQWVAQKGREVLVAADSPEAVLEWLERHNKYADAMFRVPASERSAVGMAPQ